MTLLRLTGVRKRFGGAVALDGVDFDLRAGEVHALVGENGAGKSTLIKVLGGVHRPDAGTVEIDGTPVAIPDVATADRLGVRVIHQELALCPNLSVAENLFLGREPTRLGMIDRRRMRADARRLVERLDMPEIGEVDAPVAGLSVACRQLVEIARALSADARILVLDEPTAALSAGETAALFAALGRLRDRGVGMIYISHRLDEIDRLADRLTVLRDGRTVGTATPPFDRRQVVRWMVGRDVADLPGRAGGVSPPVETAPQNRGADAPRPPRLELRDLRTARVRGVSLTVRAGEVVGLAGLVGAGRTAIARAVFGIDPIDAGEVLVDGRAMAIRSPADALAAGVVLVPEDRKRDGLVMTDSVGFNIALPWTGEWIRFGWPRPARRRGIIDRTVDRFAIRLKSPAQPVGSLSGGNQQKALVGRWMEHPPRVLVLDEPTRGVDVGAREEMVRFVRRAAADGMAVLLISSDLPEVMGLSDRLLLVRGGRVVGEVDPAATSADDVMHALTEDVPA